jgi:hypothetical protein
MAENLATLTAGVLTAMGMVNSKTVVVVLQLYNNSVYLARGHLARNTTP